MGKILNFLIRNIWLVLLVLSLPVVFSLFRSGYFGASDDMHIAWLFEMDRAIKLGQFPPRYVPDLSYGFGYPLFNFVFPLPFYIGELVHLAGFTFVGSVKVVFALSLVLSFFGMYALLRKHAGIAVSLLGAVIYTYAPYRATDIFVRGAVGEAFAFVFFPLITLALMELVNSNKRKMQWRWIGIGSLSISGLIMSHNISAYMFMPAVLFLAIVGYFYSSEKKTLLLNVFLTFFFGLLTSIYFWLPALVDSRYMTYDTVFNFVDHFPTVKQLIIPYFGYGASVPGPGDGMSFFLGIGVLMVFVLGIIVFVRNFRHISKDRKILLLWALGVFLGSIFMMNFRSTFIWKNIPLIAYFQFPWRFLTLSVFSASIFVLSFEGIKGEKLLVWTLLVVTVIISFGYFRPQDFLGRLDSYFINRYIPYPQASEEYKKTGEEYLRLPTATRLRPDRNYPELFGESFEIVNIRQSNPFDFKAIVKTNNQVVINYSKYNYPGWMVEVDGSEIDYFSGEPFGQISFNLSQGEHDIHIYFTETWLKRILDLISLSSSIFLVIMIVRKRKKN